MANQNLKYRGWCPSNDYQVHEVTEPALRRRSDRPRHHKDKGHVKFKTTLEEPTTAAAAEAEAPPVPVAETESTSTEQVNAFQSVDQRADMFIKLEHRRMELARLKSLGLA